MAVISFSITSSEPLGLNIPGIRNEDKIVTAEGF